MKLNVLFLMCAMSSVWAEANTTNETKMEKTQSMTKIGLNDEMEPIRPALNKIINPLSDYATATEITEAIESAGYGDIVKVIEDPDGVITLACKSSGGLRIEQVNVNVIATGDKAEIIRDAVDEALKACELDADQIITTDKLQAAEEAIKSRLSTLQSVKDKMLKSTDVQYDFDPSGTSIQINVKVSMETSTGKIVAGGLVTVLVVAASVFAGYNVLGKKSQVPTKEGAAEGHLEAKEGEPRPTPADHVNQTPECPVAIIDYRGKFNTDVNFKDMCVGKLAGAVVQLKNLYEQATNQAELDPIGANLVKALLTKVDNTSVGEWNQWLELTVKLPKSMLGAPETPAPATGDDKTETPAPGDDKPAPAVEKPASTPEADQPAAPAEATPEGSGTGASAEPADDQ